MPARVQEPEPDVDPAAVARFAAVVFRGLGGFADVRLLSEKGTPDQRPRCSSLPADDRLAAALENRATEAARIGVACYAVPATVMKQGRATARSVAETAVIVVDLDEGDIAGKRAHLEQHLGAATLVVASGGVADSKEPKLHLYWRLAEPARGADLKRVSRIRETAAAKVGGDASVARLQQPIRVAGSVHCKHGVRAPVRIVEDTDEV
jgi:hypothetical protein